MMTKKAIKKRIRKLMIEKEITAGDIASITFPKCTRSNVNHVINGRHGTMHVRETIARALGVDVSDLWPDIIPKRAA